MGEGSVNGALFGGCSGEQQRGYTGEKEMMAHRMRCWANYLIAFLVNSHGENLNAVFLHCFFLVSPVVRCNLVPNHSIIPNSSSYLFFILRIFILHTIVSSNLLFFSIFIPSPLLPPPPSQNHTIPYTYHTTPHHTIYII